MVELEQLISNILVPDNAIILDSTLKLKDALKHSESVKQLCQLICSSTNPMVRQYASVLLRNKIKTHWKSLKTPDINCVQESLMKALHEENEKLPLTMACNAMGLVARYRLELGQWDEFFSPIHALIHQDNDLPKKERWCFILSQLMEFMGMLFTTRYFNQFSEVFTQILRDGDKAPLSAYYITKCIMALLDALTETNTTIIHTWGQLIGKNLGALSKIDQEKAAETLDYFTGLIENELVEDTGHLQTYTNTFLEMAANNDNASEIRIKALSFLTLMVTMKKKMLMKCKLLEKVLETVLPIYATMNPDDEDDEEYYEEETYQSSLLSAASEVIEEIAVNVSPAKFMPTVIRFVESYVPQSDPYKQRGAYLVLSSVVNGCPQYIKEKYLEAFVQCVMSGMKSDSVIVKKAAFHALSHFSEALQPEIIAYHTQIMPLLFDQVGRLTSSYNETTENALTRAFCAFETYIENMEKEVLEPYLPVILENLVAILKNDALPVRVKELAVSSISSTACAAEELIEPYFPEILTLLEQYLVSTSPDHEKLQIQSIDALNMFSRCLRKKYFAPVAEKCLEFSVKMLQTKQDPDLKSVIYGLLGGISGLMKEEMKPYLPSILPHMLSSITSTAEMMHVKENDDDRLAVSKIFDSVSKTDYNDDIDLEDMADDDSDTSSEGSCAVENAYIEEKENALVHMGEIAFNLGEAFIPHLQPLYVKIVPMVEHVYIDVQVQAIKCLANFCCCLASPLTAQPAAGTPGSPLAGETQPPASPNSGAFFAFNMVTYECLVKFLDIVNTDENRDVVIAALEGIALILTHAPVEALSNSTHLEPIATALKKVIRKRVKCQNHDADPAGGPGTNGMAEGGEEEANGTPPSSPPEDEEDVELDQLVIQTAYEAVPPFAKIYGPEKFARTHLDFFIDRINIRVQTNLTQYLPYLDAKEVRANSNPASAAEKSALLGVLADLVKELNPKSGTAGTEGCVLGPKVDLLYHLFVTAFSDPDPEVRSNGVYGLGRLIEAAGPLFYEKVPLIVFSLENIINEIKAFDGHSSIPGGPIVTLASNLMLKDNVVAALCRLIKISAPKTPLQKVIELMLPNLPLYKDMTENENVYDTLKLMWESYNGVMLPYAADLINLALKALFSGKVKDGGEKALNKFIASLYRSQAGLFDSACGSANLTQQQKLSLNDAIRTPI